MTTQIRTQCCRLACGIAAFLTLLAEAPADEWDRKLPLDKINRLTYHGIYVVTPENDKCNVDDKQIATSMKFVLNTAQIPLLEYSKLEATLPPFQLLPPDDDSSLEAAVIRRLQANREKGLNTPTLLVSGDVLATNAGCVYQLEIEVSEAVQATKLMYSGGSFSGKVPLWSVGYFGIAPASDLTGALSRLTEMALKKFVNDRAEDIRQAQ
jgi:hypothetical protein